MKNRIKQELRKIIDNGVYMITLEGKKYKKICNSREQAFEKYREVLYSYPKSRFDNYHEKGKKNLIKLEIHKVKIAVDSVVSYLEYMKCDSVMLILRELNNNHGYFNSSEVVHQRFI